MNNIEEKGRLNESSVHRNRRRPRDIKRAKIFRENRDKRTRHDTVSGEGADRRKQTQQRHSFELSERQRKNNVDINDEHRQFVQRRLNCRRSRSRDRRDPSASSTSSDSPRSHLNPGARAGIVSEEDEFFVGRKRRHAKETQRSKRLSPQSGSVHDDSVGHYHVRTGEIIGDRYKILREVGLGTFGRVVECLQMPDRSQDRDPRGSREPDRYVAIKIVRDVKRYYESAAIEARIISEANNRGGRGKTHCVLLHDTFRIGGHFCLVFENLGPSLFDFMKRNNHQAFPMICVQDFTVQLLEILEFLHGFRLIHTDLKIENVLLMNDREVRYRNQRVPESTRIKIIDFGGACYDSDKKASIVNTRQYRAPEVILGTGWSMPSDMWSVGCIMAELYTGELLFATHDNVEHLALVERKIGLFPRHMVDSSKASQDPHLARKAFDSEGCHLQSHVLTPEHFSFVRKALPLQSQIKSEDDWFFHLLRRILVIDPHERATAHESLQYLRRIRRDVLRCT